jgi:tRNA A37 threonylcarbamoyladenosine synthetase subunit TsaC/SUA5/YrdC
MHLALWLRVVGLFSLLTGVQLLRTPQIQAQAQAYSHRSGMLSPRTARRGVALAYARHPYAYRLGYQARARASLVGFDAESIAAAGASLRAGELVAFPTETVYGLGADALNASAVQRIFVTKGRPNTSPLIVHVSGCEAVWELFDFAQADAEAAVDAEADVEAEADDAKGAGAVVGIGAMVGVAAGAGIGAAVGVGSSGGGSGGGGVRARAVCSALCAAFWPGPLTVIYRAAACVPSAVTAGTGFVGLRSPLHPTARALLLAAGVPVAAPSAVSLWSLRQWV